MRKLRNIYSIYLLCLFVGVMYCSITLLIDVIHCHEDICQAEDDCVACSWIDQPQDTSQETVYVLAIIFIPSREGKNYYFPD